MIYNAHFEIENLIAFNELSPDLNLNNTLLNWAAYITENGQALQEELLNNESRFALLQKIEHLKVNGAPTPLHDPCALLELKVLLKKKDAAKLAAWVVQNKEGIATNKPLELFYNLSEARKLLIEADLLLPDVGYALSAIVTRGLGVKDKKKEAIGMINSLFTDQTGRLEALAHWINTDKIKLSEVNLFYHYLPFIAPFLHHVDCSSWYIDQNEFIQSCTNAYNICIHHKGISELKNLPKYLQELELKDCNNLETLDLSNNLLLTTLECRDAKIEELNLSKNEKLEILYCRDCPIKKLDLSKNRELETLNCSGCPLEALDLSQNTRLRALIAFQCLFTTLDLSHNPELKSIDISHCPHLTEVDLSHNLQMRMIECDDCENLTTLGDSLSTVLRYLHCLDCPNLRQLPQMAATTHVYTGNSHFVTFTVSPAELEQNPTEVLLRLGEILLDNQPMPNIVYLNSVGLDAGGLRRQFVATLCENLFKKGSGFPFIQDGGYTLPTLGNVNAIKTFARLLGLKIPTGTNLHPSFFHALFALSDEELNIFPLTEPLLKKLYVARHGLDCFDDRDALEMAEETNTLAAIAISAKELRMLLGDRFNPQNIDVFITGSQGVKVTRENLKKNIDCTNETYKGWIERFIDKVKSSELKYFVMLLTGSYTLGEGRIAFEVFPDRKFLDTAIVIHSCSMSMELPGDLTETLLHKELEASLSLLKTFNAS